MTEKTVTVAETKSGWVNLSTGSKYRWVKAAYNAAKDDKGKRENLTVELVPKTAHGQTEVNRLLAEMGVL